MAAARAAPSWVLPQLAGGAAAAEWGEPSGLAMTSTSPVNTARPCDRATGRLDDGVVFAEGQVLVVPDGERLSGRRGTSSPDVGCASPSPPTWSSRRTSSSWLAGSRARRVEAVQRRHRVVIGVDTHKYVHVAVALDEFGGLIDAQRFAADRALFSRRLLTNPGQGCRGVLSAGHLAGIGTGCKMASALYAPVVAVFLLRAQALGEVVLEVDQLATVSRHHTLVLRAPQTEQVATTGMRHDVSTSCGVWSSTTSIEPSVNGSMSRRYDAAELSGAGAGGVAHPPDGQELWRHRRCSNMPVSP